MSTQTQEAFIKSISEAETILTDIGLSHISTEKKGYATFVGYKGTDTLVSFMFGPSDWNVEILLAKNGKKYAFEDLLQIPLIAQWTIKNKFRQVTNDRIKDEVFWFVNLTKFLLEIKQWEIR
jgi:aryl-phospho-beta-D-glucosidase BglC (GH1 family)